MPAGLLSNRPSSTLIGDLDHDRHAPGLPVVPTGREPSRRSRIGVEPTDALLPLALGLWIAGVRAVQPAAMNDYGLLPALPVVFFVGLGLLVCSIAVVLIQAEPSPVRLVLHLIALVLVLHGTIPLIFSEPNFPWVYKHVGVVGYINLHGALDSSVDIYQNWPGFFALATWFTRIAGLGSPLAYAAWAPVYFNLLTCLVLAFVFRSLPVTRRVRWLAQFLFVAGNWVGQDYFAPQALAFVLSLAVLGMVLAWFQVDRPPAVVRALRRLASHLASGRTESSQEDDGERPGPALFGRARIAALSALFATFVVTVVTHQLSPYVVILGVGLLTVAGMVRPRWLVVGLVAIAIGYLLLHLSYIQRTQDLFGSLGDPLHNVHNAEPTDSTPMKGRRLTALAAPVLIAGMWMLGMLGVLRRLRARRTTLVVALLAASPALIALGQSYGGEAVFRIYLFSLPWTAVLAASALDPNPRRRPLWSATKVAVVLSVALALFMSSFYGAQELYVVRPGEVAASQYFYDHAARDSVLTLAAPNFPTRVGDRYDQFRSSGDNLPSLLTTVKQFRHRMLGPDDLPAISEFVDNWVSGAAGDRYLVLSTGQDVYARVLGLVPPGSLANLERALAESPNWSVYYRNPDAVIYQSISSLAGPRGDDGRLVTSAASAAAAAPAVAPAGRSPRSPDQSLDWAATGTGLVGLSLIVLVWRRRRVLAADHSEVVLKEEEAMPTAATTKRPDEDGPMPSATPTNGQAPVDPAPPDGAAPTVDIEDLVSQSLLTSSPKRQPFHLALDDVEPEPARIRELVAGVEPARRPEAIQLLGDTWGPLSSTEVRPLLDDVSSSVRAAAVAVLELSPDAVVELHRMLRYDLSSAVRVAAIRAFAQAPEEEQLPALSVALADPDPEVRTSALETLPVAGKARAARAVLDASDDRHPRVRQAAYGRLAAAETWIVWMAIARCSRLDELCAVLRQLPPDDQLATLVLGRISSPEPGDRILALELAGRLEMPGWVAESVNALRDPDADVRRSAAARLQGRAEVASALVAVLRDDPDAIVRAEAASALDGVESDDALVAFIGALQDPEPDVRSTAIEALVRRTSPGLARHVATGLTTANVSTVGQVLLRMGTVGEEALVAAALEGPSDRASAAAELLSETGKRASLLSSLRAVDPATRLRAVDALGALGGPDALSGLVAALSDSRSEIRSWAAFHLGRLGDLRARDALQRISEGDQALDVLRAAGEALCLLEEREHSGVGNTGELSAGSGGSSSVQSSAPPAPEETP